MILEDSGLKQGWGAGGSKVQVGRKDQTQTQPGWVVGYSGESFLYL